MEICIINEKKNKRKKDKYKELKDIKIDISSLFKTNENMSHEEEKYAVPVGDCKGFGNIPPFSWVSRWGGSGGERRG